MPSITVVPLGMNDLDDLRDLEAADHAALLAHLRWCISTPYAIALKAVFGEALICGVATAIAHAGSGWLGERIVHPHVRQADVGGLLARALMGALGSFGSHTLSIIVRPAELALFQALGFHEEARYWHWEGGQCEPPATDDVRLCAPEHTLGVLHLDHTASGEDRRTLISEHLYAGRVFVSKARVLGAYLPLLGEGLVCASNTHAGLELLRWHLVDAHSVTVPATNIAAANFLLARDYSVRGEVVRMCRGRSMPWQPGMIYAWGAAWLG